jgi:hypothetical protein
MVLLHNGWGDRHACKIAAAKGPNGSASNMPRQHSLRDGRPNLMVNRADLRVAGRPIRRRPHSGTSFTACRRRPGRHRHPPGASPLLAMRAREASLSMFGSLATASCGHLSCCGRLPRQTGDPLYETAEHRHLSCHACGQSRPPLHIARCGDTRQQRSDIGAERRTQMHRIGDRRLRRTRPMRNGHVLNGSRPFSRSTRRHPHADSAPKARHRDRGLRVTSGFRSPRCSTACC